MANCAIFDPRPTPYYDQNGLLATGAKAYFYLANTTTPMTVYSDQDLTTPHAWPVVADAHGILPPIYLPFTDYRVTIKSREAVTLWDAPLVPNPAPASSSSGGGITVNETQILQVGDTIWRLRTGAIYGFARMNGRTIGSASSGATEYAGLDAQDLFAFLWENLPDGVATVSGGRGASASADWASNKTIIVPSMQGRAPLGLDDMGGTAAQAVQVITTVSVTNGSPTCTVGSAAGLARGMNVLVDSVSVGTISSISGTTITLSTNYGGTTGGGKEFRASFFADAQAIGSTGGAQTFTQTTAEMPNHNHALTDPGHQHDITPMTGGSMGGGVFGVWQNTTGTKKTETATTGITLAATGSGLPSQIIQPSRLGTFYMKM